MSFGPFIRAKREQSGEPLNRFARGLGVSPAYWSRIERDMEKPPKDELVFKSAERLGINPDEAFIAASRLPPDMMKDIATVVRLYRGAQGAEDETARCKELLAACVPMLHTGDELPVAYYIKNAPDSLLARVALASGHSQAQRKTPRPG